MPFTAVNGASWAKFRKLLATGYADISVVSIAANGHDMSFSSDTGIAECLVVGRKAAKCENPSGRAQFMSLRDRPRGFAQALEASKAISIDSSGRSLEDGPYGGDPVYSGEELIGEMLEAPVDNYENGWGAARILDAAVPQVAHLLKGGELFLPGEPIAQSLPMAPLKQLGRLGVHDSMLRNL